ncbi:MAG: DNA-processing protein DprA [Actinomycetota bacterium]
MIDTLFTDAAMRSAAQRLRPDRDAADVIARAAWSVVAEPGDGVAGALVAHFGPEAALRVGLGEVRARRGSSESGGPDLSNDSARALREGRARWRPRAQHAAVLDALQGAADVGARALFPGDECWPERLDDLALHAPVMLWVRGGTDALATTRALSVVGARAATAYGEHIAAEFSGELASQGTLIVSGGAYGIDGAAHRAALGAGGATVAFLAGGVDRSYPRGHQQLFTRIMAAGAIVSELPVGAAPTKWRFLSRNRLIAALGTATVVIEAGWRSGSLNTAGHAAELGRPVGAVPGPITSAASAGCHRLLREYDAQCVTTPAEVRQLLGDADSAVDVAKRDPERARLLDVLSGRHALDTQEIARRAGFSEEHTNAILGLLLLEGCVERRESGWRRT